MTFRQMIFRQFTLSPKLFVELSGTGLLARGIRGDGISLLLAGIAVLVILAIFQGFRKIGPMIADTFRNRSGRLATVGILAWLILSIGIVTTNARGQRFNVITLIPGDWFGHYRLLTVNPKSGYQGYAGGIQFGPGEQWAVCDARAEYDRNRFLDPGMIHLDPKPPYYSGHSVTFTFPEGIAAGELQLISRMSPPGILDRDVPVAEIRLLTDNGAMIRLPVLMGIHTGCTPDHPPVSGTILYRDWPALRPVEENLYDTRVIYDFPAARRIQSMEILYEGHPATWHVRGVAFSVPSQEKEIVQKVRGE